MAFRQTNPWCSSNAVGQLEADLRSVDESLSNAQEALRFNLMGGQQRSRLAHFHSINVRLEPVIARLQALVVGLGSAADEVWMTDRALTESLANLISAATMVITDQGPVESGDKAEEAAIADVSERVRELTTMADDRRAELQGRSWTRLGLVVESANAFADSVVRVNG